MQGEIAVDADNDRKLDAFVSRENIISAPHSLHPWLRATWDNTASLCDVTILLFGLLTDMDRRVQVCDVPQLLCLNPRDPECSGPRIKNNIYAARPLVQDCFGLANVPIARIDFCDRATKPNYLV